MDDAFDAITAERKRIFESGRLWLDCKSTPERRRAGRMMPVDESRGSDAALADRYNALAERHKALAQQS